MSRGEGAVSPPLRIGQSFDVSFDAGLARTRETLDGSSPAPWSTTSSTEIEELHQLATDAPGAAVIQAYGIVRQTLVNRLGEADQGPLRRAPWRAWVSIEGWWLRRRSNRSKACGILSDSAIAAEPAPA